MLNENQIIEACIRQDRQAQKQLYEMFSGQLFVVALRYMKDHENAKDVLQDAFIKVFRHLDAFRNDSSLMAWMRKIVVNTALKAIKKDAGLFQELDNDYMIHDDFQYSNIGFENLLFTQLLEMIGSLPDGCRTIFNLYAIEGYKHHEISKMLGVSEGTSKSQYSRAKMLLQKRIGAEAAHWNTEKV